MIRLTRLDGEAFVLNADLIRYGESRPDVCDADVWRTDGGEGNPWTK
ncbi:MAG: flagellar FlbD family protein [Pirellulales bacterium]